MTDHPHPHPEDSPPPFNPLALPAPHPDLKYRVTIKWEDRHDVHEDIMLVALQSDVYFFHNAHHKFFTLWVKHPDLVGVIVEPLFDVPQALNAPPTMPTDDLLTAFITKPIGMSGAMYRSTPDDPEAVQIWYMA